MQRFIISPLFALSRFFINIYGIFLKFFLLLNGGYWSRIGLAENITEERIKKRRLYILPFYILLALLSIYLFGGEILKGFSLAMILGVYLEHIHQFI